MYNIYREENIDHISIELCDGEYYDEYDIILSCLFGSKVVVFSLIGMPMNGLKNINYGENMKSVDIKKIVLNGREHDFLPLYYNYREKL